MRKMGVGLVTLAGCALIVGGRAAADDQKAQCLAKARQDFVACRAPCDDGFKAAKAACRGLDAACVATCGETLDSCLEPFQNQLHNCLQPCEDTLKSARDQCKTSCGCSGSCDTNACFIQCLNPAQVTAFVCKDTCRDNFRIDRAAQDGTKACRNAFKACLDKCKLPPPSPGS